MTEETQKTEDKILTAAREVFQRKGLHGTRMQEIADEANINKALLHYYFRSKEKLFEEIFQEAIRKIIPTINQIFESNRPLFTKIEQFVDQYISIIEQNPHMPSFIIHELNQDPAMILNYMKSSGNKPNPQIFIKQIRDEVDAGNIQAIDPYQLVVNMISMCIFPFIAQPIIKGVLGMAEEEYQEFLTRRKKEVSHFIINAIKL